MQISRAWDVECRHDSHQTRSEVVYKDAQWSHPFHPQCEGQPAPQDAHFTSRRWISRHHFPGCAHCRPRSDVGGEVRCTPRWASHVDASGCCLQGRRLRRAERRRFSPSFIYQHRVLVLIPPSIQIYKWKNIRFAAPPVGDLRWAKPAPPPKNPTVQDGSYGPQCPQASLKGLNVVGSAAGTPLGVAIDKITAELLSPGTAAGSEDCLFLDIFVPGAAVRSPSTTRLPVIHWFFGGGYIFGSKDQLEPALPFYDGTGMISQSGNNVIFVASNYRLGALGFLAGTTMEKQGLPNAGLWDQRAALQWTQDNIALIGGDPTQVTAMGESAGAGSILHHLVAEGGTLAPLFSKAIMQSPAFQPNFGRREGLQSAYSQFETLAGCTGKGVACLRAASSATLLSANTALNNDAPDGTFVVGPSADGNFIRQLPALELASGNYYKGLSAALVSHVSDESTVFVDGHIATDDEFNAFLNETMPAVCTISLIPTPSPSLTRPPVLSILRPQQHPRNFLPRHLRPPLPLRQRIRPRARLRPGLLLHLQHALPCRRLPFHLPNAILRHPRLARNRPHPHLLVHLSRRQHTWLRNYSLKPPLLRLRERLPKLHDLFRTQW